MKILQWHPSQRKMTSIQKVVLKLQSEKAFQSFLLPKLKSFPKSRKMRVTARSLPILSFL